jgi:hypothetical protein
MSIPSARHENVGANQQHYRQPTGLSQVSHKISPLIWRQSKRLPIAIAIGARAARLRISKIFNPGRAVCAPTLCHENPFIGLDEILGCAILLLVKSILTNGCRQIQFS